MRINKALLFFTAMTWMLLSPVQAEDDAIEYKSPPERDLLVVGGEIDCRFTFVEIIDDRQNKTMLGSTFSQPLKSDGIDDWMKLALADFTAEDLIPPASPGAIDVEVQPYLTRLYSYNQNFNIHGVMALRVDYRVDGETRFTRWYRNMGVKTNWAGAIGEYHTSLNMAAGRTLPLFINDLAEACAAI